MPKNVGQFGSKAADELRASILHALRAGYRLIDTAQYYGVEEIVGAAVRDSEVPRSEITVVTKFWGKWHHDPAVALEISLRDLNIEYIDILLMHWPWATSNDGKQLLGPEESPTYVETWKKMEALVGPKCRAIGVSNFTQKTLSVLLRECKIVPAVNQVELHALNPNLKLTPWCEEHGIKVMSWRYVNLSSNFVSIGHNRLSVDLTAFNSTMGGGAEYTQTAKEILSHPLFKDIAVAHNIPVGVVSLSWAVQRGIIVIPKSSSTTRIDSNIRLVRLTDTEMETISNAENIIGRIRLADNIPAMQKEFRGRKTVMGWTAEDYGWEDSEGNWLT